MQAMLFAGFGGAAVLALIAMWRDRARTRRLDPDAVGAIDWRTIEFASITAAILLFGLAANMR